MQPLSTENIIQVKIPTIILVEHCVNCSKLFYMITDMSKFSLPDNQVLDACVRLYDYQGDVPVELFIVRFLESCSAIQVTENELLVGF